MSTQIILKVLALRHRLRQRDRWTRRQLEEHQDRALRLLREHAYARSPFYGRFHRGLADRPLSELPVLTKEMVMERFDELVTDPTVRLADVEAHFATLSGGDELFNGRYRVASTSGSTGRRGLFLWDPGEWAAVLASYNRSFDWAGVGAGLTRRTRMAVVSSTTPWHQSARVGASVHSPWVPTLRIDSGDPLWRASSSASTTSSPGFWWPTPRWHTCWQKSNSPGASASPLASYLAVRRSSPTRRGGASRRLGARSHSRYMQRPSSLESPPSVRCTGE